MRAIPKNIEDISYLVSKIGRSPLRGILLYPWLPRGSRIPFIGKNVKIISARNLLFGKFVWIGHGCYIDGHSQHQCKFGHGTTIREYSVVQCRSGLNSRGHSLTTGCNVFIGPFAKIGVGGQVNIGNNCQIGSHFSLNAESHAALEGNYVSGQVSRKGINIGENVWIGDKVTILDGVNIGRNSVVGAGSVVRSSFPEGSTLVGAPARQVK